MRIASLNVLLVADESAVTILSAVVGGVGLYFYVR
jgi:hypothetical protein